MQIAEQKAEHDGGLLYLKIVLRVIKKNNNSLEFLNPLFCFRQALDINFYDNGVLEMDFQMLRAHNAYPEPCCCEEKPQPVTDCND